MRRVVLRGLATRRLRTVLSAIAVVLGVALVTGAMTLGGALDSGASKLASSAYDTTDAVVAAPHSFKSTDPVQHETIPASTLQKVRAVPGVGVAVGDVLDEAKVLDKSDGKPIGQGPYFGVGFDSRTAGAERVSPLQLTGGRWATGPGEVVIDRGIAKDQGGAVRGRVRIIGGGAPPAFQAGGIPEAGGARPPRPPNRGRLDP